MTEKDKFSQVATQAASLAGDLLLSLLPTDFSISFKGDTNLVTEADIAAERLIVNRILEDFPDHTILAEENHALAARGSHTWIIDPLDGTTNYAHRYPVFAVSIGLEIDGELECGVVYNPNMGEMFTARRGGGAFLNGRPIRVSGTERLDASLLATGFPYDLRSSENDNLGYFSEFMLRSRAVRRAGSAALDLAYVAAGRFDGFWELKLSPWDMAAGYLLVREAGGVVTDFSGAPGSINVRESVASNGRIHDQMLAVLKG